MNRAQAMRYVFLGFAAAVVLITYHDIRDRNGQVPTPAEFLGAASVYGIAGVLAELAPGVGGALAIAWTIGLLLGFVPTNAPFPTPATTKQKVGEITEHQMIGPGGGITRSEPQ